MEDNKDDFSKENLPLENNLEQKQEEKVSAKEDKALLKEQKIIPKKKIPGLLKKSYTEKNFNKKILKAIDIPSDKQFLQSLFVKGADLKKPENYAIPSDFMFTKTELKKCKLLCSNIKSRKGRFLFVPFIAVVAFIFVIVSTICAFKNPLAKKAIVYGLQTVAGAKADVDAVDLRILGGSLTVKNIAVGNKNDFMKNIAEAEKINFSFDFAQALRGKLYIRNMEVSGLAINTDRTTSCELPVSQKKLEEQKKKEEKQDAFVESLKVKSNKALDDLQVMAFDMIGGGDVESIIANIQSQLKSPQAADAAIKQVNNLVVKWQAKPAELKTQIDSFSNSINDLQKINVEKIKDAKALKEAIEKVNVAIEESKKIKQVAESVTNEVLSDGESVKKITQDISDAVLQDKELAETKLNSVVNTVTNSKAIFTSALDTVAYNLLGSYYPYVTKGVDYAYKLKNFAQEKSALIPKSAPKNKKPTRERMAGTTFWFTKQNPTLLIENALVTGKNFEVNLKEVTNDQNVRNKVTTLTGSLNMGGIKHNATATLDIRTKTTEPLIAVDYVGDGFKVSFDGTTIAEKSGIPSLDGVAKVSLGASADVGVFNASGSVSLNPLVLKTDGFENAFVTKYYKQALDVVKDLSVGYETSFNQNGVNLNLTGDFADKFAQALKAMVESFGNDAKVAALKFINAKINDASNEYLSQAKDFFGIQGDIDIQNTKISDVQKILEKKQIELEEQLKKAATEATNKQIESVLGDSDAAKAATETSNKLINSFSTENLLKGFGKKKEED